MSVLLVGEGRGVDWSDDGASLVSSAATRSAPSRRSPIEIWMVLADGTGLRQLTHFREGPSATVSYAAIEPPRRSG